MQKRILSIAFIAFLFSLIIGGCSKLDTTDIGSDLLPAVDNVSTFDTLLTINATQGVFVDSTRVLNTDDHALGIVTNDPLFGTTNAAIYAQFKPNFYPFYYGNPNDTIVSFDSVVLCLSYKGFWGDTLAPLKLQVQQVAPNTGGLWDSVYESRKIDFAPAVTGPILGTASVDVKALGGYFVFNNRRDSAVNQVRIKLTNAAFNNLLYTRDSLTNKSFSTDTLFKLFNNGFAITATGGNGLMYTNLADSTTRLEVHYTRKNGSGLDTGFTSLKVYTTIGGNFAPSATVNTIKRVRTPQASTSPPATEIYLQSTPGTYANLNIPALSTLSNRVIHRAEIIIEQIPTDLVLDGYLSPPNYLYLDVKDTGSIDKWKPISFDLNPNSFYDPEFVSATDFPTAGIDFPYFGGYVRSKTDVFGNAIKYYNINITRHVQQIVTKHTPNYIFRLYAPYNIIYPQHSTTTIPYNNRIANGRVRVGSGSNTNYKMRLRIVYSKI